MTTAEHARPRLRVVGPPTQPPGGGPPERPFEERLRRNPQGGAVNSYGNTVEIVRGLWSHRLRYNTMREVPELDGVPYDKPHVGAMRCELEARFSYSPKAEDMGAAMLQVAFERPYHPVQEYLTSLPPWDGTPRLRALPRVLFGHDMSEDAHLGTTPPLPCIMLERWFISAVARAFDPGCQVDTVLILQSDLQGTRKSTFFRAISSPWMGEGAVDTGKEGCFALAAKWVWCWDELSGMLETARSRGYAELNSFITRPMDTFRPPWRPSPIDHPRSTVIAATANPRQILGDPTGDRRWWIVEVRREMAEGEAAELRPHLWAEALALYRAGQASARGKAQWWLTREEEHLRASQAEEWRIVGGWDEPVARWLASAEAHEVARSNAKLASVERPFVTTGDILSALGVRVEGRQLRSAQTDAGISARRAGWQPMQPRPRLYRVQVTAYAMPNDARVIEGLNRSTLPWEGG